MIIKVNKDKVYKECGIDISTEYKTDFEYINYIKKLAEFLESHNKNYTREQYYAIIDIKAILESIEEVN